MAVAATHPKLSNAKPHKRGRSRVEMNEPVTLGERVADAAAGVVGSWRLIIIQSILVGIWIGINVIAWDYAYDRFPFGLLNLMFSVQATHTRPILPLASTRQATTDRA